MKVHKLFIYLLVAATFLMITACGGGGGGGSAGSGELAIDITDAKPLLPTGVTNFFVTFTDVLAHRSGGGGWESLPMPQETYTIDLLQFHSGETTELVPPVILESGKYTQIRLVVSEAKLRIVENDVTTEPPVEIPSENLKTDKNFDFNVEPGGAVDILIDFDLSQSLVVTYDGSGTPSYKLKPVLHIVDASEAATISGAIDNASFYGENNAIVTVFYNNIDPESPPGEDNYEEYTKVEVSDSGLDSTEFSIFWLPPNVFPNDYKVVIVGSSGTFEEPDIYLEIGDTFVLNSGDPI
jgi:hypothetical protein